MAEIERMGGDAAARSARRCRAPNRRRDGRAAARRRRRRCARRRRWRGSGSSAGGRRGASAASPATRPWPFVDRLEIVDVDREQSGGRAVARGLAQHALELADGTGAGRAGRSAGRGRRFSSSSPSRARASASAARSSAFSSVSRSSASRASRAGCRRSRRLAIGLSPSHGRHSKTRRLTQSLGRAAIARRAARGLGRGASWTRRSASRRDHHGQPLRLGDDAPCRRDARRARRALRDQGRLRPPHAGPALRLCQGARRGAASR